MARHSSLDRRSKSRNQGPGAGQIYKFLEMCHVNEGTFKFWDGYREFDTEAREILNEPGKANSKTYYSKDSYKLQANGTSVTHVIGPDFRHPLNTVFSRLSFKSLDNVDSKKAKPEEAYMNIFMLQNNKSKHQDY